MLTGLFLLHTTNIYPLQLLDTLEKLSYDTRVKLMQSSTPVERVVIIDIDERSLSELGRWPWNRSVMAEIVNTLFDHYHINSIGFDMVFAEPEQNEGLKLLQNMAKGTLRNNRDFIREYRVIANSLQGDDRLSLSLRERNTVLGFVMDTDIRSGLLPEPAVVLDASIQQQSPFVIANGYTGNIKQLQTSTMHAGFFDNPMIDSDGVVRRSALLQQYGNALYESLALALTRAAIGSPQIELIVQSSPDDKADLLLEWLKIGGYLIPVDAQGGLLVPYRGKQGHFSYFSAVDVLNKEITIDQLTGKIALFGASAVGLHDRHTTPLETAVPGSEIHANIVQGILDQTVLHQPGYTTAALFILLLILGLVLTFAVPLLSPTWAMIVCSLLVLSLIVGNLIIWRYYELVFPVASSVLLVIVLFTIQMSYGFFVENRNKRQLKRLFGRYVPPGLLDELNLSLDDINLNGEIREMTVMFCDIRNFTSISETMTPEEITRLINAILTPVTDIIHQQHGTVDKYIGDAVMAFWGAPQQDPEHAQHAITAALAIEKRIKDLNNDFRDHEWPEINVGIGINTGKMNVGNKGSEFRVDYTVLGDAVNLAARLEKLTKHYGTGIIVGENTRRAAAEFEFRQLDLVTVKGKNNPVTIYEPLGPINLQFSPGSRLKSCRDDD
jgi:adenylate cyclase